MTARAAFDPFTLELHRRLCANGALAAAADPLKVILQTALEVAVEFKRDHPEAIEEFLRQARASGRGDRSFAVLLQNHDQLQLAQALRELVRGRSA